MRVGYEILKSLGLRNRGVRVISCPSCARQGFDVIRTVEALEERLAHITTPMSLSVLGCVVNGPGEARETDIGITGGGNGKHMVYLAGQPAPSPEGRRTWSTISSSWSRRRRPRSRRRTKAAEQAERRPAAARPSGPTFQEGSACRSFSRSAARTTFCPTRCGVIAVSSRPRARSAERYGYQEMATPIFEFSEVFKRTLGDTSDIVTKEMYTFTDRGGETDHAAAGKHGRRRARR